MCQCVRRTWRLVGLAVGRLPMRGGAGQHVVGRARLLGAGGPASARWPYEGRMGGACAWASARGGRCRLRGTLMGHRSGTRGACGSGGARVGPMMGRPWGGGFAFRAAVWRQEALVAHAHDGLHGERMLLGPVGLRAPRHLDGPSSSTHVVSHRVFLYWGKGRRGEDARRSGVSHRTWRCGRAERAAQGQ